VAANQEIKGPASGATNLKRARRNGEALVRDRIQLQALGGGLLAYTELNYTGADAQLDRRSLRAGRRLDLRRWSLATAERPDSQKGAQRC
jgi:hypothetical protein